MPNGLYGKSTIHQKDFTDEGDSKKNFKNELFPYSLLLIMGCKSNLKTDGCACSMKNAFSRLIFIYDQQKNQNRASISNQNSSTLFLFEFRIVKPSPVCN